MTSQNNKTLQRETISRFVLGLSAPIATMLLVLLVKTIYLKLDSTILISYFTSDRPPLPYGQLTESFGDHFFGDYAMNYWIARSSKLSIETMYQTSWFPSAYLFLQPFTFFSYRYGLFTFMLSGVISIFGCVYHAARNYDLASKFLIFILVILASGPVLSAFDRGNEVIFLIPIAYLYFLSVGRKLDLASSIFLALAVALKPHMVLLVIPLMLTYGGWKRCVKLLLPSVALQGLGYLITWQNPLSRMFEVLNSANRVASESVFANSASAAGALAGLGGLLPSRFHLEKIIYEQRNLVGLILVVFVVGVSILLRRRIPFVMQCFLVSGLITTALPFSPPYNAVITCSVLLIRLKALPEPRPVDVEGRCWDILLFFGCAGQLIPIPIEYRIDISYSRIIAPASYVVVVLVIPFLVRKNCERERKGSLWKLFWLLIIIAVSSASISSLSSNSLRSEPISYLEAMRPVSVSDGQSYCDVLLSERSELRISFTAHQQNSSGYQNLFQTADLNEGIRIERAPTGEVQLLVGERSGTFEGLSVPSNPIEKEINGQARIRSNGAYMLSVNGVRTKGVLKLLRPECNHVLVGTGFSPDRTWQGTATVTLIRETSSEYWRFSKVNSLLFGSLALLLFIQLSIPRTRRNLKDAQ